MMTATINVGDKVRYEFDDAATYRVIYTLGEKLAHIQRLRKDGRDDRRHPSVTARVDLLTPIN